LFINLKLKIMKAFNENETIIWLVVAILLMAGYWITQQQFFLLLSLTSLIMSRISRIKNK